MRLKRKHHKYPYIVLLIIHTLLLLFTFYKNKDRQRLLVLLTSNIGLAYLFEYFAVNLFHGYSYKPNMIKSNHLDRILGAVLSQAIYVPFTALFLTAFNLKWKSRIAFSAYFTIVEIIFLKLNIYKHTWYKTSLTFFLTLFYFKLSDFWYKLLKRENTIIKGISLYFFILISCVNMLFTRAVRKDIKFGRGHYHSWTEHFIIAPLYSIILSIFATWIALYNSLNGHLLFLCFRITVDFLLVKYKWLKVKKNDMKSFLTQHLLIITLPIFFRRIVYKVR